MHGVYTTTLAGKDYTVQLPIQFMAIASSDVGCMRATSTEMPVFELKAPTLLRE
jgi:hypothetical protein